MSKHLPRTGPFSRELGWWFRLSDKERAKVHEQEKDRVVREWFGGDEAAMGDILGALPYSEIPDYSSVEIVLEALQKQGRLYSASQRPISVMHKRGIRCSTRPLSEQDGSPRMHSWVSAWDDVNCSSCLSVKPFSRDESSPD